MREYILKLKSEAQVWENASPIGAGSIGAMIYGGAASEHYCLNEETIWNGGPMDTHISDYYDKFLHIRKLFLTEGPAAAEAWAMANFKNYFFEVKSYESAGDFYLDIHNDAEVEAYQRNLDLKRGILTVDYERYGKKYHRESFASHPARLICTRVECDPAERTKIYFVRPNVTSKTINVDEENGKLILDMMCTTADGNNKFRVTVSLTTDGQLQQWWDDVYLFGATYAEAYISIVTDFRDPELNTEKYLAQAERGFETLKAEHIADFSKIMERSDIVFGKEDPALEDLSAGQRLRRLSSNDEAVDLGMFSLYYQFGKYLLVSSSREDTFAANLQGLWVTGLSSPWNSDYHTNINLQMNYWPAESANIPECTYGLFNYINDTLLEGARKVAKDNYKSRGAVVHHISDIYGFAAAGDGIWGLWQVGGAWLAYQMWERYLYSGDKDFLRNTAYEFIRDSALFFIDSMFEGPDGKLHSGPSSSPENSYLVDYNGEKVSVFLAISPTMDIQIIGGLLDFYAECEDILGIDPELGAKAREVRARMPEMKIGSFGQLQEWLEDYEEWEPGHRHISHSFGLYPAAQITRQTPEYFAAMRKTLERRLENGGGHTGWSRAWLINLFARLRNGEAAYENFRALLSKSTLYNLFDNHPPFQIDGNFGGCAAIAEMVLQSHEGFISLLPAINENLSEGYFENLCARGGYTVSAQWKDMKITSFTVNSNGAEKAEIELPEAQKDATFIVLSCGCEFKAVDGRITVPCGKTLTLK